MRPSRTSGSLPFDGNPPATILPPPFLADNGDGQLRITMQESVSAQWSLSFSPDGVEAYEGSILRPRTQTLVAPPNGDGFYVVAGADSEGNEITDHSPPVQMETE